MQERNRLLAFAQEELNKFCKWRDEERNLLTQTGNSFTPRLFYLDGVIEAFERNDVDDYRQSPEQEPPQ
jgi:hypothetical protein